MDSSFAGADEILVDNNTEWVGIIRHRRKRSINVDFQLGLGNEHDRHWIGTVIDEVAKKSFPDGYIGDGSRTRIQGDGKDWGPDPSESTRAAERAKINRLSKVPRALQQWDSSQVERVESKKFLGTIVTAYPLITLFVPFHVFVELALE